MSISRQNLSIIIVTFKSENVIDDCIKSINDQIKIIIVDNSNDLKFKENIEKKYKNVQCILSKKNVGMGAGNNIGLNYIKTDYAFILNPDVILENDTIDKIFYEIQKIESFGIIAPISDNNNYPNYKFDKKKNHSFHSSMPFQVKSVDGYAMLLNLKRLNQKKTFENLNFFDENFFMYLENDDLCKRVIDNDENIYVVPQSKIKHLGAKAVNEKYNFEVELSRNWHWIWSKFYFNKKHYGYFLALCNGLPTFFSSLIKFIFYLIINNSEKKLIYLHRLKGYLNALKGKKSWYRPTII